MKSVLLEMRSRVSDIASDVATRAVDSIESYGRAGPALGTALEAVAARVARKVIQLWEENRPADAHEIARIAEIAIPPVDTGIMLDDMLRTGRIAEDVIWTHFSDAARHQRALSSSFVLDAATIIQTFFNEATTAITRIYLDAEPRHLLGRRDAERVFVDAITAEPPRFDQALRVARSLGLHTEDDWQARVVQLFTADAMASTLPTDRVAAHSESRIIILGGPCASLPEPRGGVVGIGGTHRGLHGIRASYDEALEALRIAERKRVPQVVYEHAWLDRYLLGTLTPTELVELVFAPLNGLPQSKRRVWEQTLEAWLDCAGNVAEISKVLTLHPQSTRYRIGRLKAMFKHTLSLPEGRLAMHVAVKASRLIDRDGEIG
jgi:hypothetical protein